MERAQLEGLSENEATDILLRLSKAWEARDCSAIQRLSERLPVGYAFAVFAPREGSPCFSIVSASSFALEIPQGYTYIPDHQLLVSSMPETEPGTDRSAIDEAGESGLQGNLDPSDEGLGDKSNQGGPQ